MNPAKRVLARTQQFVSNHKVAIAVVASTAVTAAACLKLNKRNINQMNEFLTEKGLFDEFWNTPEI